MTLIFPRSRSVKLAPRWIIEIRFRLWSKAVSRCLILNIRNKLYSCQISNLRHRTVGRWCWNTKPLLYFSDVFWEVMAVNKYCCICTGKYWTHSKIWLKNVLLSSCAPSLPSVLWLYNVKKPKRCILCSLIYTYTSHSETFNSAGLHTCWSKG